MELEYTTGMIKTGRDVVDDTLTIPMFYFWGSHVLWPYAIFTDYSSYFDQPIAYSWRWWSACSKQIPSPPFTEQMVLDDWGPSSFLVQVPHWLLPGKPTCPLKIDPWKRRFLVETTIFRGYVSFREGIDFFGRDSLPNPFLLTLTWLIMITDSRGATVSGYKATSSHHQNLHQCVQSCFLISNL